MDIQDRIPAQNLIAAKLHLCLEALACGLPVAALPVPGPLDVIGTSGAGALDMDLRTACLVALEIPRGLARAHALTFTWAKSARQFLDNILFAVQRGRASRRFQLSGIKWRNPDRRIKSASP